MKKDKIKIVISAVIYIVGFLLFTIFLAKVRDIDNQAWIYSIISSFGVLLFCISNDVIE